MSTSQPEPKGWENYRPLLSNLSLCLPVCMSLFVCFTVCLDASLLGLSRGDSADNRPANLRSVSYRNSHRQISRQTQSRRCTAAVSTCCWHHRARGRLSSPLTLRQFTSYFQTTWYQHTQLTLPCLDVASGPIPEALSPLVWCQERQMAWQFTRSQSRGL